MVWSSHARDLSANLANVFVEEGIEEATRKAAAATARRTELMRRCYTILRVALQDIIEGKVGTCGVISCLMCSLHISVGGDDGQVHVIETVVPGYHML